MTGCLELKCGKKKVIKCNAFINDLSTSNIIVRVFDNKNITLSNECKKNEISKDKTLKELKSRINRLTKGHSTKIDVLRRELIQEEYKNMVLEEAKSKENAKELLQSAERSLNANCTTVNLKQEIQDLESQLKEFNSTCSNLFKKIKEIDISQDISKYEQHISETKFLFVKEFTSFENPLPIYKFRGEIQATVRSNRVTLLMAETGSGKSTQVAQYLHHMEPDSVLVCTQPRKIAAVSLASHVAKQMGTHVGGVVGYKVGSQTKVSKDTRVIFMTDQMLVNECVKDPNFTKYNYVILDEVHERSINTDLLLGLAKDGLKTNPNLRIVITSATMDPKLFYQHFEDANTSVATLKIPGRTFPIDVKWISQNIDVSRDYLRSSLRKVEDILERTDRGDVLVFLATPADTDQLATALAASHPSVDSLQLHGKLQVEEQRKIFEPGSRRRVIFSTNCAETSVTVPGIKYVVDPGVAKEKKFDPVRNSSSLVVQKISQSSARQRAGRAGRTEPGECWRLYSEQQFQELSPDMVPEIRRVQLGLTILKLIDIGIQRPDLFPFIESPGAENIQKSIEDLIRLGALAVDESSQNPNLTELGRLMSKLPLDPRLSKLVLVSNAEGNGENALVLASLCSMAGNVFFRMGSDTDVTVADQKKMNFCAETGDFLTLVNVFNAWNAVKDKSKSKWCVENFINGKSMKMARDMLTDLKSIFKKDIKLKLSNDFDLSTSESCLLHTIFQSYRDNLCVYGGHPKFGYINLKTQEMLPIHPSSAFSYLGNLTPELIIYDQILSTSRTFLLNLSKVDDAWLDEEEKTALLAAKSMAVSSQSISPVGPRILKQSIIGYKRSAMKKLEMDLKEMIGEENFLELNCDVASGSISWTTHASFHSLIQNYLIEKINGFKSKLSKEKFDVPLIEGKSRPKAIYGSGGVLDDIILENEFNDIMLKYDNNCEEDSLHLLLDTCVTLEGFVEVKHLKSENKVLVFENFESAIKALPKVKFWATSSGFNSENVYPLRSMKNNNSKVYTGLQMRVRIPRRPTKKFGFLKFEDEEDAFKTMNMSPFSLPNFVTISPQYDKKGGKKSLYFNLRNYSVIPLSTTKMIKSKLRENNINFSDVFIPVEGSYETTKFEKQELRKGLSDLMIGTGIVEEKDFDLDVKNPNPKTMTWYTTVNFHSSVLGMNVGNNLKKKIAPVVRWMQTPTIPRTEQIEADFDLTTSFSCPRRIFDLLKNAIEATVKEVDQLFNKNSDHLSLNIEQHQAGQHGNERAVFFLKGTELSILARTKDALDSILKGIK